MRVMLQQFSGKIKRLSERLIPAENAQICTDALLETGKLRALPKTIIAQAIVTANPTTIFRYDGAHWFTFTGDVDVVEGAVSGDAYKRVYFTGQGYPRVTRNDMAVGPEPMPVASYRLGVPSPPRPTLINITGSPEADSEYFETAYVQTFVTPWGEEGPPSDPSVIISMAPGQTINLNLGMGPTSGNYNLGSTAQRRLYRLNTSNGVAEYQRVNADGSILYPVDTYSDNRPNSELGGTLPVDAASFRVGPPDDNASLYPTGPMIGLTAMPGGFFAGFTGKTICFCEPYLPQWWPLGYRINTHEDIVAIKAVGDGLVVCTKERPYLAMGSHPASMTLVKLETRQGCVSKRSLVDIGGMVIFASPDGLVGVSTQGAQLLTEGLFTREQWQAYNPATITAYYHEGKYVGFYEVGSTKAGFIFDPRGGANAFTDITEFATAGYNDLEDDALYLAKGTAIHKWQASSEAYPYTWKSKVFVTPLMNFSYLQVDAETYPVNVKIVADGVERFNQAVSSIDAVRLPAGFLAGVWELTLTGTATVNHVLMTDDENELLQ